tara:strand:- start:420 stop:989 length:570 start_codon:yes stop_codon:yes gene_type:complete
MKFKSLIILLGIYPFLNGFISGNSWKPPVEPENIRIWRKENTHSSLCTLKTAAECTKLGLIPDTNWIYIETNDDGQHTYYSEPRRDIWNSKYLKFHVLQIYPSGSNDEVPTMEIEYFPASDARTTCTNPMVEEYLTDYGTWSDAYTFTNDKSKTINKLSEFEEDKAYFNELNYFCKLTENNNYTEKKKK